MLKKILLGLTGLLVLLGGAFLALFGPPFLGLVELNDGQELGELKIRTVRDGYVASYLIPISEKSVALVDCGVDANGATLMKELQRRGLGPEAVQAIFLTHAHHDHIAACHLFPRAKVYAFEGDAKAAAGEARTKGPLPSLLDTPVEKRIKVTDFLADGVPVQVEGVAVTPYHVPGHTAGSAAFLAGGVLMLGDNATLKKDGVVPAPWIVSDDVPENQRSLQALYEKLKPLGTVETLAFSHSGPVEGLDALARAYARN
jgi:glyoxylase-like metal-dependent hydrolase (beta-lactamase superfamily II)